MVQIKKIYQFDGISPKILMEASYRASGNYQVRSFYEAKDEILETGKFSEDEFFQILDSMIDAETERKYILSKLEGKKPMLIEEIVEYFKDMDPINIIADIFYLKEQGYIEQLNETVTKIIKKKIEGKEEEIEEKTILFRYQAKELTGDIFENHFEPVSLVYEAGVCCNCGWCSSICPVNALIIEADNFEINEDKCIKCGLCFSQCPRSFLINESYKNIINLNKKSKFSEKIGGHINTYSASTKKDQIKKVCQDGGIVTTIAEYLLENKIVEAVVAVKHSKELWRPEPVIVEKVEDLYETAGTKYANAPTLNIIEKARAYNKIAVVGVPCMMKAIVKGNLFPSRIPFFNNIEYKIGLFCMESFSYENIKKLTSEIFDKDVNELTKMNIDKGKFIITLKSGEEVNIALKEVQSYARDICHYCDDLTSEYADISVGSIGSQSGWSSVITRSEKGDQLYKDIVKSGLIESKNLKDVKPGLFLVEKIGGSKRKKCKSYVLESD
ncbi:MAG: Coenzyme F420 hydrogenase/dehydrogenase, beta subunit C-terminal domain [Candidatus Lokiarchaeota archaeon]